ncbi:putative breast carcinoma AMPlified sequence, partial [Ixodes scapularis]
SSSSTLEKYACGLGRTGNPRPFPSPTVVVPLSQIKQGVGFSVPSIGNPSVPRSPPARGRRVSGSASSAGEAFSIAAAFAPPRAWLVGSPSTARDKKEKNPVDSLFIMNCNGILTEYIIDPRPCTAGNKVSEDSPIELDVTAYAQWNLLRPPSSPDTKQPLGSSNPLMTTQQAPSAPVTKRSFKDVNGMNRMDGSGGDYRHQTNDDSWLSQVEIITHVGPHRRLWMGPQFSFKIINVPTNTTTPNMSVPMSQSPEKYAMLSSDMYGEDSDVQSPGFSGPVSVPMAVPSMSTYFSDNVFPPLLIEATSDKKCLKKLRLTQNELSTAVQIRQIQARSGGTTVTSMADMDRLINQLSPSLIAANGLKAKMPRLIECELTEFRPIMWGRPRA